MRISDTFLRDKWGLGEAIVWIMTIILFVGSLLFFR